MNKLNIFIFAVVVAGLACRPQAFASKIVGTVPNCESVLSPEVYTDAYWSLKASIDKIESLPMTAALSFEEVRGLFRSYIAEQMHINDSRKGGKARRAVLQMSNNPWKTPEFRRSLQLYGIEVYPIPYCFRNESIKAMLSEEFPDLTIMAMINEESRLLSTNGDEIALSDIKNLANGTLVSQHARLTVRTLNNEIVDQQTFEARTPGIIDASRLRADGQAVFGWDDRIVHPATGLTNLEMAEQGFKITARDQVISKFIEASAYYKKPISMNFNLNEQMLYRPVDFDVSVAEFVETNPYLNNTTAQLTGLSQIFSHAAQQGLFFRAPHNRRLRNYWMPNLNAGLPMTPKNDAVHEITYFAHDLGHFLIPDLVYIGNHSDLHKKVYVMARMMSEAVTLVLADMIFVDTLARAGVDYDYSKRKAYPLFQDLGIDLTIASTRLTKIKELMKANVEFCLTGRDSLFRNMLLRNNKGTENLEIYKNWYATFFIQDYSWTEANYENMTTNNASLQHWWTQTAGLRENSGIEFDTVDHMATRIGPEQVGMMDRIFEDIFERRLRPAFHTKQERRSRDQERAAAFTRYMVGQMAIFSRYHFVKGLEEAGAVLTHKLMQNLHSISQKQQHAIRVMYDENVQNLEQGAVITSDDRRTFREIFPLFPPVFMSYNSELSETLPQISQRILGDIQ